MEIDEMGIEVRELRRTKRRLQREIQARRKDVRETEKVQLSASHRSREAKAKLDLTLSELHFLEESQTKAAKRSQELRAWLDQLAKDEKERKRLEKRKQELPALIKKSKTAVADEEAELSSLNEILKQSKAQKAVVSPKKAPKPAAGATKKGAAKKGAAKKGARK